MSSNDNEAGAIWGKDFTSIYSFFVLPQCLMETEEGLSLQKIFSKALTLIYLGKSPSRRTFGRYSSDIRGPQDVQGRLKTSY